MQVYSNPQSGQSEAGVKLVVHDNHTAFFVKREGTWWKILFQRLGAARMQYYSGQYASEQEANDACYRYAAD